MKNNILTQIIAQHMSEKLIEVIVKKEYNYIENIYFSGFTSMVCLLSKHEVSVIPCSRVP